MTTKLLLAAALTLTIAAQPDAARRLLDAKCLGCHGAAQMSGLDLRTPDSLRKGGNRGPSVLPGNAAGSLLFQAVSHAGPLKMPPGKQPLSPAEQRILKEWIDSGAALPASAATPAPAWWAFRPPVRPRIPASPAHPIDALLPAHPPEASQLTLVRRAYFDLHGLPPTPAQVDEFLHDDSPAAWPNLIDKLLASPRYGERWGRYWLDLVRYADTAGFETDHFYINAWRYRDYVIAAFNADKPYTEFVQEQIAADEIWPMSLDLEGTSKLPAAKAENLRRRIATGLFTLGSFPIEYTYYGDQFRAEWRAEAVDVIGSAFLGLTLACARCHDHKFDPLPQRDYYRLTALFAGSTEREIPLGSLFDVQTSSRNFPLLAHAEALKQQVRRARGAERDKLLRELGEAFLRAPSRPPTANVLAPDDAVHPTHILIRGDFKNKGEPVQPGFLSALHPGAAIQEPLRRKALAQWLTHPANPLLARVMVNRIWQGHFGHGIVRTPNDFGRQGELPTHPELLDLLATEFAANRWSIKSLHRLIMTSRAYRATSQLDPTPDPDNRSLSRMSRRRLDADALRDSALAVAGLLNLKMGGVGVIPKLSSEELLAARMPNLWPAHPDPAEHHRRSIYLQMKRSLTLPMLQVFDAPDPAASCARRESSTVAPQALALLNSEFSQQVAAAFAARLEKEAPADPIPHAWRLAFGRPPSPEERATGAAYLARNSLPRLCLLILNMSEFLYVD
jgi:cytochrome c553